MASWDPVVALDRTGKAQPRRSEATKACGTGVFAICASSVQGAIRHSHITGQDSLSPHALSSRAAVLEDEVVNVVVHLVSDVVGLSDVVSSNGVLDPESFCKDVWKQFLGYRETGKAPCFDGGCS